MTLRTRKMAELQYISRLTFDTIRIGLVEKPIKAL